MTPTERLTGFSPDQLIDAMRCIPKVFDAVLDTVDVDSRVADRPRPSRAVAVSAAKPVAEEIQARLKHVIPEGLRLAQQDFHSEEARKRDYPWLAGAHLAFALRSNSSVIFRMRLASASSVSRTRPYSVRKSGSFISVKSSLSSFMALSLARKRSVTLLADWLACRPYGDCGHVTNMERLVTDTRRCVNLDS